jgi:hypothetical protein
MNEEAEEKLLLQVRTLQADVKLLKVYVNNLTTSVQKLNAIIRNRERKP